MRKIHSIFFGALAFAAASCQVDVIEPEYAHEKSVMTITAGFGAETKTALAENGKSTWWNADDMISVFDARTENNNRKFTIVAEEGTVFPAASATFATEEEFQMPDYSLDQALIVALYPYQEGAFCNFMNPGDGENLITGLNLPAEQKAVKDGFDPRATFALATDKYTNKDNVAFHNLYSLIKVSVAEEGVKKIKVVFESEDNAAGDAQVVLNRVVEDDVPVFEGGALKVLENGSKEVTLGFDEEEAVFEKDAVYGIAIAPLTYTNIKVYLDGELAKDTTPAEAKTLVANTYYTISGLAKLTGRGLSFPEESYNVLYGNEFTAPELSGKTDGVKYSSSNTAVATVNETTGEVEILAEGTTVITATAPQTTVYKEESASYTLTVGAKAARNLAFNPTALEVAYDATSVTFPVLEGETEGVTYSSSDTGVATVDHASGVVSIVGVGETTITASADANETHLAGTAEYTLTVTKAERTVSFAESSQTVTYGDKVTLPALTGETDDDEVTYSIADGDAANITAEGVVTLVKAGTVTVQATVAETATHKSCSATYTLTVNKAQRTLQFSEATATATVGKTFTPPTLTGTPDTEGVTYTSSNNSVATVNASTGKLELKAEGKTVITATIGENEKYTAAEVKYELDVEEIKLYIENDSDYTSLYLYLFDSANNYVVAWPGTKLTEKETVNGVEYYVYKPSAKELDKQYTYIFNNNGQNPAKVEENKTIKFDADKYIWLTKKYTIEISSTNTGNTDPLTIYVRNDNNWSTLTCYMWLSSNDKNKNEEWPGVNVDKTKTVIIENATYHYIEKSTESAQWEWDRIIISDNGQDSKKTSDLTVPSNSDDIYVTSSGYIWKGEQQTL